MPRFVALICAVLFGAIAPAVAQDAAARREAVQEFRRFFKKFKTVEERIEAVRTLEMAECPEAASELFELLEHRQPEVARTAVDVLGTYRQPSTFAVLLEELPEMRDQTRRARLIEALGRTGIREAVPAIVAAATEDKKASDEVRYAAARAAAALGGGEGVPSLLESCLTDGDALVRMGAAEAVGMLRLKELGTALVPLVTDGAWQVESAAIAALATVREPAAVPVLIERMREGGRLEEECADALFRITGMDFGIDADTWQAQWDRLSAIEGWRIPTDEELAKAAASRKKYDAIYGKREKETTSFGGIPTTSTRILFIIDVSGSMADLVVEHEKFDAGYEDFEKLTIVKTELLRTIDTLDDNTLFNIVAFARDLDPWKRDLVRGNVVNRASAKAWVERLKPIGGPDAQAAAAAGLGGSANLEAGKTNTFAALMVPFGVDPQESGEPAEDALENPIDTVFFLSDGRPSTGKHTDEGVILEEVARLNERFRIVVHTIAIGDFQKSFLKSLAEMNGGAFVDLGR